jgi:dihydrolipoamide dehydrogenase
VGYTEQQAKDEGYDIMVGKFPYSSSGKAAALGHEEGF